MKRQPRKPRPPPEPVRVVLLPSDEDRSHLVVEWLVKLLQKPEG